MACDNPLNCVPEIVYDDPRVTLDGALVTCGAQAACAWPDGVYSATVLPTISTCPVGSSNGEPLAPPFAANVEPSNSYSSPLTPNTSTLPLGNNTANESPALSLFGKFGPVVHVPAKLPLV